jgi:hypothetical protein
MKNEFKAGDFVRHTFAGAVTITAPEDDRYMRAKYGHTDKDEKSFLVARSCLRPLPMDHVGPKNVSEMKRK